MASLRDVDGMSYLEKYAYGLPLGWPSRIVSLDDQLHGSPKVWFDPVKQKLCAEFPRRKNETNLRYIVEASSELKNWEEVTDVYETIDWKDDWEFVGFQDGSDPAEVPFRSIRIRIVPVAE